MTEWFGHQSRFAIALGDYWGEGDAVRILDVYAADRRLTCDENHAYVPHFAMMLKHSVGALLTEPTYRAAGRPYPDLSPADNHRRLCADAELDNRQYLDYRFMDWGPTTDSVRMHYFREGDTAYLPFSFWPGDRHDPAEYGEVFVAELPWRDLACVLHEAAWALMWKWANRSPWPRQGELRPADGRLASALASSAPADAALDLARRRREEGMVQAALLALFDRFRERHALDCDEACYNAVLDAMDHIVRWCSDAAPDRDSRSATGGE